MRRKARNFFKTPKGLLTIILVLLAAIAAPGEGLRTVLPGLLSAVAGAGLVDMAILRLRKNALEFPSGAVLTAMIVSMVLRSQEPWYVVTLTSITAILSKYIFRSRHANVFNPAALAVIASFYVFHTGQSWWGRSRKFRWPRGWCCSPRASSSRTESTRFPSCWPFWELIFFCSLSWRLWEMPGG